MAWVAHCGAAVVRLAVNVGFQGGTDVGVKSETDMGFQLDVVPAGMLGAILPLSRRGYVLLLTLLR